MEWRCGRCRVLLGVERQGRLFLRHKEAQYIVVGETIAICRRCGLVNDRSPPSETTAATRGPHRRDSPPPHAP